MPADKSPPKPQTWPAESGPNSMIVPARIRPLRAMIVEDDPAVARSLSRWLKQRSVEVAVAMRPSDVARLGTDFDVGIFDIDLPELDGVQLAKRCLEQGIVRRAVFFSGSTDPDLRRMAADLGDFVEKGSGLDALSERVLSAYRPSGMSTKLLAVG